MGRTACTEPQCLYKGALYLTVELYLYSPYGPYGLYRASVPVQGCTLPLPLHKVSLRPYRLKLEWSHFGSLYPRSHTATEHYVYKCSHCIYASVFKLPRVSPDAEIQLFFFFLWRCVPTRVMASSFLRFLDRTQRCATVGRIPLDE